MHIPLISMVVVGVVGCAPAQQDPRPKDLTTAEQQVAAWRNLLVRFPRRIAWVDGGKAVAWPQMSDGQRSFVRVDCATGERRETKEPGQAGLTGKIDELPPRTLPVRSQNGGDSTQVRFVNELDQPVRLQWIDGSAHAHDYGEVPSGGNRDMQTFDGHAWRVELADGAPVGAFVAGPFAATARIGTESKTALRRADKAQRPPNARKVATQAHGIEAFAREHSLFVRDRDGERRIAEGTADDFYRGDVHVAPDGSAALAFQVVPDEPRIVTLVESSPKDQTQPKVHELRYPKPGDRIARPRPRLLDLKTGASIDVDEAMFADPWSIDRVHWMADSREVRVLYNRRGHQQLAVRAIDAKTGNVRTIVDETSKTFVDYSQKTNLIWLQQRDELLWTSERDGNCHLYRIDAATGAAVQLTRGDWRVRKIEHVDEAAREVWITALGFHQGQDPYHRHLVRVPLDGGEPVAITSSDGDCEWELSEDRSHAIVRWSRIDCPTVTELRRCRDGALVAELGRDDASKLFAAGFAFAERFVAKGRDGATDIHGIALMPKLVRDGERLPVLEAIYAGPHDFHVPKSFDVQLRLRALAELGFCVVQIDGMGTNWRSKSFHDVCWQNLKDAGFPDRISWIKAFASQHAVVDASRVGVFGGSAGGQNAMAALLWHGDFYKAAAADCGCHDNRMDKIWWNEAWMGWPVGDHYAASSNVVHASRLQGKLLLTVGEMDRNVDPASTLQVVDALLQAGKDFDFVLVPGGGHGCGEMPQLAQRRAAFFVRHLRGGA